MHFPLNSKKVTSVFETHIPPETEFNRSNPYSSIFETLEHIVEHGDFIDVNMIRPLIELELVDDSKKTPPRVTKLGMEFMYWYKSVDLDYSGITISETEYPTKDGGVGVMAVFTCPSQNKLLMEKAIERYVLDNQYHDLMDSSLRMSSYQRVILSDINDISQEKYVSGKHKLKNDLVK